MDTSTVVIDLLYRKYKSDQNWVRVALQPLSEEDIRWSPTPESNSISNLVAHISDQVKHWFEIAYLGAPYEEVRSNNFEHELQMTKEQASELFQTSYDHILEVIEIMKANPERLLEQPYLNYPPFNGGLDNQATILEMLLHHFRHFSSHVGQIIYISKMRKGQLQW
ncbi:DinB family protein [Paenibacillus sacheonensis]|uniref:DUF1572 domain-containing protein n=1 Tax=Paenibacillus sacheonensis TaxID=742054 RepID=A0A7X4YVW7_9BACL|nr:DinB family protein [Paenibacillus sacheonensis]MBM7569521.1 putative damage-inducible protein DinB [Paenibacillus sacheonensis]NBC73580.1 DUF1572 domain-containing protein [Paenibacillus sacheonensis]